jgi:dihydrodipicolinate synthase/N-acetylneuraminate lyase
MSFCILPRPLTGIIPPLVTPLADSGALDRAGLERLVEHVLRGGVHGLFVLGTTGEGPSLAYAVRRELVLAVCEQVAGRVPVLVGITDTSWTAAREMAGFAADAGAAAVVLAPPPYFTPSQTELRNYLWRAADASPLPLMLYDLPSHTKVSIEPETVRALADHPRIAGLKDSSGKMIQFHRVQRLLRDRPDFTLLLGPEELLAESVLLGGHGGVNGGANLVPEWYVQLYAAARRCDLNTVRHLHDRVIALSENLYPLAGGGASLVRSLKAALAVLGLCRPDMAEPFTGLALTELEPTARCLRSLGLSVPQPA